MAVKTTAREQVEYKKYVGFVEAEIMPVVNPTLEQLKSLGIHFEQEPEYVKEVEDKDKEGEVVWSGKQLTVSLYFKSKEGIFNTKFFLKDRVRMNRDKTKTQYINAEGNSSFAESEEDLQAWFTKGGSIRKAMDGEADLMEFFRTLLNKADRNAGFEVSIDNWKKLMSGNVKEILDIINDESVGTVLLPLVVRVTDDGKEYQQIFNKSIVPGYMIKNLRLMTNQGKDSVKDEDVEKWFEQAKVKDPKNKLTKLQKAILLMEDREYGCGDTYYLGLAKEYNIGEEIERKEEPKPDDPGY